jgi:hypothetical protein
VQVVRVGEDRVSAGVEVLLEPALAIEAHGPPTRPASPCPA